MIATQKALRAAFWRDHPGLTRRTIVDYVGTGRMHCADSPDAPDFPYVAQWCAEQYIRDIGCPWVISSAGQLDDGSFVFIVKGDTE